MELKEIAALIRDVPDFPKPGIIFKDITTLTSDAAGFRAVMDIFIDRYKDQKIDKIVGIESRGFVFGGALGFELHCGVQLMRKPGKLPADTISASYELEYGTATLELHKDAVKPGERVLIIDDLLATGGTIEAATELVERLGGQVVELAFVIELDFLHGREKTGDRPIFSILHF
ncbi:MAG: adenine phosphoribosyltransferase [Candidatus Lernaella stagnicola]|nr:adenine phosphoribosyltransferase [Candidatus Lernaella stagnicola]